LEGFFDMSFIIVGLTAFLFSVLSFFSGFGLATTLLPAFAIFFTPQKAVAATAIVHAAHSALKAVLMRKHIDWTIFIRFGLPAVAAAVIGAAIFSSASSLPPIMSYHMGPVSAEISIAKLIIATMMTAFALGELLPSLSRIIFPKKYLILGGLLSGFFGGLSGHQGALRSAFMTKLSLTPNSFIGTGSAIGLMVDLARLSVYLWWLFAAGTVMSFSNREMLLIVAGLNAALLGVIAGRKLIPEASMSQIRYLVGIFLLAIAALLGLGLV
jgi:uncharacterized protein